MKPLALRGLKFYTVGGLGILVQLTVLGLLKSFGWSYLAATAVAVEAAVIHNFLLHEFWTWRDRRGGLPAFVRFNLTTGLASVVSNVVLMRLLVGSAGFHWFTANLIAVGLTAIANFLVSEYFVFRAPR